MEIVFELDDIQNTAKKFLQITKGFIVFAFQGELGAGKTTFISSLCKEMGINETVTSPTFSIIQEYVGGDQKIVYHIDLYRIKSSEEAMNAGIEDCINSGEICMIEWPEKAPEILPEDTVFSSFEIISPRKRKMVIQLPR
jgi:tRNA threonylcarbamoyladenosine biosynthesis protein TsaE